MRTLIVQTPDARKMLEQACVDSGITKAEIARRSGVRAEILRNWFRLGHRPRIDNFCAVANAAGYDVILVPKAGG